MKKFLYVLIFVFLLGTLFTSVAFAQDDTPTDDEVNAVAHKLYCPVCEAHRWMFVQPKPAGTGAS